jgi:SAM-dependent methyltransferase
VLDMGCGGGRHAFELARRGADVVALDYSFDELVPVQNMLNAMRTEGQVPVGSVTRAVRGDATRLPFADAAFDRIIAAEVMEHIDDDGAAAAELARVLRPGGMLAVTVPSWLPEKVCWALSDKYHAPHVTDGHVRIYTRSRLAWRVVEVGLRPTRSHHAHALHSPYWWMKCALGLERPDRWPVRTYHRFLVWDIMRRPLLTRALDRALNPVLGKSLVLYATKP